MPTLSLEFLSMTISTLLASWFAGINRVFEVYYASSRAVIWPWPTISRRTLSCVRIRTFTASGAKRDFPPGSTALLTTVSANTRGAERNWSAWMRQNGKAKWTRRRSMPV